MTKGGCLVTFALAVVAGGGCERPAAPVPATPAWGRAVGGLEAGLGWKEVRDDPSPSAVLVFRLRNAGTTPIRILRLSVRKSFWGDNLPVEVNVDGKTVDYRGPVLEPPPSPAAAAYIVLAPGETDSVETTFVARHWGLDDPRRAEITFVFRNTLATDRAAGPPPTFVEEVHGLWTGEVRSNPVTPGSGAPETIPVAPASGDQSGATQPFLCRRNSPARPRATSDTVAGSGTGLNT